MGRPASFADAIPVSSRAEEYRIIHTTGCRCGGYLFGRRQELIDTTDDGRPCDLITARCIRCGDEQDFLSDISAVFGRSRSPDEAPRPPHAGSPYGTQIMALIGCVVMGTIAAPSPSARSDSSPESLQ